MGEYNNLVDIVENNAEILPQKTAMIFQGRFFSFKELDYFSCRLAYFLKTKNVSKGDRICLWMYNCPEFVISYFAVLRAGAIVVPIDNSFTKEEALYITNHTQARMLICGSDKISACKSIFSDSSQDSVIISFAFDENMTEGVYDIGKIISDKTNDFPTIVGIKPQDTAQIIYTSGTTGKSKGVCISHQNLISNLEGTRAVIRVRDSDTFMCILPLAHSFALTICMLLPLYSGVPMVIFKSPGRVRSVLKNIMRYKITVFVGIPSLYRLLNQIKLPFIFGTPLFRWMNPVRMCCSGGAALEPAVIEKFEKKFRVYVLEGYGLTEASPVVSLNPLGGRRKIGSVGRPLPHIDVKVVDKEGKTLSRGQVGELLVRGPNIMKGYFKMPEETGKVLRSGWLHTADLAKIDQQGYIYIVGRIKDMINIGGIEVSPREIEEAIYKFKDIVEVSVVGITHSIKGEVPVGFVVFKKGSLATSHDIASFLNKRLASFKIPFRFFLKESLPKNSSGKIAIELLREEAHEKINSQNNN